MIVLNLLMFGGNGSSSGGGGGGKASRSSNAPGHHGSAGGRHMDGSPAKETNSKKDNKSEPEKENRSIKLDRKPVTAGRQVDAKDEYVLMNVTTGKNSRVPGEYLSKQIKDKKTRYDKKLQMWVGSKGRYIIYRIRRK